MPWSSAAPFWSDTDPVASMSPFHTWHSEDSPALFVPQNLLRSYFDKKWGGSGPVSTDCKTEVADPASEFNGYQVVTFEPRTKMCTVTIASFDLATSPAKGAATYFLIQAKLWQPATLRLTIDPGQAKNGSALGVRHGPTLTNQGDTDEWQALTFTGTLGVSGTASFGLVIEGGPASVAGVVAAPIGQEWSRLLLSSRGG